MRAFCRWKEEWELCTPQGQWRRSGRGCFRHWSRDYPTACRADHGEASSVAAAHGGPCWSRCPPAAHGGPHTWVGGCLKEAVTPWRPPAGVGSWQDLWTCGERSPCWSRFAGKTCDPVGTHTGAACSWRAVPHGKDPCRNSSWRTAASGKDSHWRS